MTRLLLVVLCVALVALTLLAMRRGWRHRLERQTDLATLPELPADLGEARLQASGLYVGTTFAISWQDRVVHEGLGERAAAQASLHECGLVLRRQGGTAVFVPAESWVQARLAPGLAGKVMGEGGLLVVRWLLGDAEVDTGFRADDKSVYPDFVRTINARVSA